MFSYLDACDTGQISVRAAAVLFIFYFSVYYTKISWVNIEDVIDKNLVRWSRTTGCNALAQRPHVFDTTAMYFDGCKKKLGISSTRKK